MTKDEYYARLLAVTEKGAWEEWLLYFVEQVRRSGDRTLALVKELTHLQTELTDIIRDLTGTANGDLATVLMEQPYVRMKNVLARCSVSRPTASGWLKKLSQAGVVSDIRVGRDVVYVNHLEKAHRTVPRWIICGGF